MANTPAAAIGLAQAICRALKARALSDRPGGHAGGKGGNNDGSTGSGGGQSWTAHQLVWSSPLPPEWGCNCNKGGRQVKAEATKRVIAMAMRVASNDNGDGDGGKSNGSNNKGGGQATTRAMAAAMTVANNDEGNGNGNEGGE